jgi:hypothetical protein
MLDVRCRSKSTRRDGQTQRGGQRWRCGPCQRHFTARSCNHLIAPMATIGRPVATGRQMFHTIGGVQ